MKFDRIIEMEKTQLFQQLEITDEGLLLLRGKSYKRKPTVKTTSS